LNLAFSNIYKANLFLELRKQFWIRKVFLNLVIQLNPGKCRSF